MRKRRTLLIAAAYLAALIAVAVIVSHDRQPRYQGRSYSEWLDWCDSECRPYHDEIPTNPEPTVAILKIGTNALPTLLKWVEEEPTDWRKILEPLAPHLPRFLAASSTARRLLHDRNPLGRRYNTELAFYLLGTNANCALPALTRLLNHPSPGHDGFRAALALGEIGPAGYEVLLQTAADPRAKGKEWADATLTDMQPEILTNALTYPSFLVRSAATNALLRIATQALTNAPPD